MGAYVTPMYGGSDAQVDYRLGLVQHGCASDAQLAYHTDARERPLTWIGSGLDAFGVAGVTAGAELTTEQYDMARRLVRGQHPGTGEQLVDPKVAVPADAKLPLGALVAVVGEAAVARGVDPAALFDGVAVSKAWAAAARGVERRGGRAVSRADEATALAKAAGLDPGAVWGGEVVAEALGNLYEPGAVLDEAGDPVLGADGLPVMEMVARRERVGIAGFDLGINLPNSLSVLLGMAPDDLTARIEGIYAQATERTIAWTEARTSYVKRGHHGDGQSARAEASSGFAGWVMTHRTARPVGEHPIGDPHWHVHVTLAHLAQAPDGTWMTIAAGGRELMRHAPAIDKVTQAQVRAELRRDFGITFARSEKTGVWEVEHIPQPVLELFSKRHAQVTKVLDALGYTNKTASAKDARVLTRESRSAKSETTAAPDVTLREYWRAQAIGAGYDPANWMPAVLAHYHAGRARRATEATERANETMLARHGITLDDVVARLTHPDHGLTAHTRRFSHLDAITATADALPYGASPTEVEALTDLVLAHPSFAALPEQDGLGASLGEHAQLAGSHDMAGGRLFTTADIPAAERTILDIVAASHADQRRAVVEPATLAMAIEVTETAQGYTLSAEQRAVLEAICTGGRGIESLEGPAGTGKTTVMRAARVAWEAQGFVVAGAATAAVAAQGLAAESGIDSRTCEQWRMRFTTGPGLTGVDVLVLDESTLTDDRDRAALYTEAARVGARVVEIQDPKQLSTPGCGSLAGYIHAVLDGPRLTENRRQQNEDERTALAVHRDGRYLEALSTYDQLGQVVATHTTDAGVAEMVAAWLRTAAGAPDPHTRAAGLVMVSATNEATRRINEAVQAVRVAEHQLGDKAATYPLGGGREVTFHLGDQVLIRTNDRTNQATSGEPVLNGYRGVITAITPAGVTVQWHQAGDTPGQKPHTAVCKPDYIADGGLDLGYCLTTHKGQGMTVRGGWDRPDGTRNIGTVLAWAPGMDARSQYVALSRDVGEVIMFGALDDVEGEREHLLYGAPRSQQELTDRVLSALAERATATATNPDDQPILVDLGTAPTLEDHRARHAQQAAEPEAVTEPERQAATERAEPDADAEVRGERVQSEQRPLPDARAADVGERADRIERLRQETFDNLDQLRTERQTRQSWWERPFGTLAAPDLDREINAAEATRAARLAEAQRARTTLVATEPAVAAGTGPRVTALAAELAELRRIAELATENEALQRRLHDARTSAAWERTQALNAARQADATSWFRPRTRDRLQTEAAQHARTYHELGAEINDLTARAEAIHNEAPTATHSAWQRREAVTLTEASYPTDRQQRQRRDETDLADLRDTINTRHNQADTAAQRRDALAAEQQLRAEMPPLQSATENVQRLTQQRLDAAQRAAEEEQRQADYTRNYYDRSHTLDHGNDHGLSL
ncbi:MAG: MobF family relaxase [Pseudonocardiaceae bacterium]